MNPQQPAKIPVSSSYVPFIPSPEFWESQSNLQTTECQGNQKMEGYVPEPVSQGEASKYSYTPTPISQTQRKEEKEVVTQKKECSGSLKTQQRKARRLRQKGKNRTHETYVVPTAMIPVKDAYWFPVFWYSKKPTNEHYLFKKTFVTLRDKQRVMIKTFNDGKITVWRAGEEITLRKANPYGIGLAH